MSKQIDERVVEMRFDNQNFERNVKTTMSTLDKLKQSLHLDGAAKSFENISNASKRVDMTSLGKGVETVRTKFSALEVMGVTALANITNSAINAGKRVAAAFTIEPIKTGFNEYELKMGAIQTIMASTGESLNTVNQYLNELNTYSDKTIYSFSDMTTSIGKFTNAGVKLEDAVLAMKGISNEAAISGANANEASRAMYNFAQAISMGYVQLIDWKSIENANMATIEFKQQLLDTAVATGVIAKTTKGYVTAKKNAYNMQQMFKDGLKDEWLQTDVLIETLRRYADENTAIGKKAYAAAQDVKTFSMMMDTLKEAAQSGWSQTWEIVVGDFEEAKSFFTVASNALGKVIDKMSEVRNKFVGNVLKSNFEKLTDKIEAAGLSTEKFQNKVKKLAKSHGVDLNKMIKKEGSFEKAIQKAFNNGKLDKSILKSALKSLIGEVTGATKATGTMADAMKKYGSIVTKVIRGDFGNGATRIKKLTAAGYDYATIQNLVNEKLGINVKHISKLTEAQKQNAKALESLTEKQRKNVDQLAKMTDKQLKAKGFTEDQIDALRELSKISDETKTSMTELLDGMGEMSGREKLIETLKNVATAIGKICKSIGKAWTETFKETNENNTATIIDKIYQFSKSLEDIDGIVDKITRIAKGIFAFSKLMSSFSTNAFLVVFDILKGLLGLTNWDLLDFLAAIGDQIVKVRDVIFKNKSLKVELSGIATAIGKLAGNLVNSIIGFLQLPGVVKTIDNIKSALSALVNTISSFIKGEKNISSMIADAKEWISGFIDKLCETHPVLETIIGYIQLFKLCLKGLTAEGTKIGNFFAGIKERFANVKDLGQFIIDGIRIGLENGTKTLWQAVLEIGTMIIDCIKMVLGIHSPSTVMIAIGSFIMAGLLIGLQVGGVNVWDYIKGFATNILDFVKNLNFGGVFAAIMVAGVLVVINNLIKVLDKLATPLTDISGMVKKLGGMFDAIGRGLEKKFKAEAWAKKSEALLNVAKALALLAASVFVLAKLDSKKMWSAVGAVAVLTVLIGALAGILILLGKMNFKNNVDFGKMAWMLISLTATLAVLALVVRIIGKMNTDQAIRGFIGLIGLLGAVAVVLLISNTLVKGNSGAKMDMLSKTIFKLGAAMMLLAFVVKIIGKMSIDELKQGAIFAAGFVAFMFAISLIGLIPSKSLDKIGRVALELSGALLLLIAAVKIIGTMSPEEIFKGIAFVSAFVAFVLALSLISLIPGVNMKEIGLMTLAMSAALVLMAGAMKLVGKLSLKEIGKGIIFAAGFVAFIGSLIAVTTIASDKEIARCTAMILASSIAMAVLAGVCIILGFMNIKQLAKGVTAVTILGAMLSLMIYVTKDAKDIKGTMIGIAIAIGVMAAAITVLSFIDPKKLFAATAALSAVMLMFGVMAKLLKGSAGDIMKPVLVMVAAIAVIGGMLFLVGQLNPKASISAAVGLSALLLALGIAVYILSDLKLNAKNTMKNIFLMTAVSIALVGLVGSLLLLKNVQNSISSAAGLTLLLAAVTGVLAALNYMKIDDFGNVLKGVGALALVMVSLFILVGVLWTMNNLQNAVTNAMALSALVIVLTGLLIPIFALGAIVSIAPVVLAGIGALALMMASLFIIVGVLRKMSEIQNAEQNALLLTQMMVILVDLLMKVSFVAPLAAIASVAILAMVGVMGVLGTLITIIGAFSKDGGKVQTWLTNGLKLMALLAEGLGEIIGAFVGGIAVGLSASMVLMGVNLSLFMKALKPFIAGAQTINSGVLKGVGYLALSIVALTAASLISGLTSFIPFAPSFGKMGKQLSKFMKNAMPFIVGASCIMPGSMDGVKTLAEAILILTAANVVEGISGWIIGTSSLSDFGSQLGDLGTNLSDFANNLGTWDKKKVATVTCAGDAIKAMAQAASSIPKNGGLVGSIFGDKSSISDFCSGFADLGTNLNTFASNLGTWDKKKVENVKWASKAIVAVSDAASGLPNEGGKIAELFGDNSLSTFSGNLPTLGTNLDKFASNLGTWDETRVNTVVCATDAMAQMAEIASGIDGQADWSKKLFGDNSLSTLGTQLGGIGTNLNTFATNLGEFNAAKISTVKCAVEAIVALSGLANADLKNFKNNIGNFGEKLTDFASDMSSFCTDLPTGESIDAAIAKVNKVVEMTKTLPDGKTGGLSSFAGSLKNLGKEGITKFTSTFTSQDSQNGTKKAGETVVGNLVDGLKGKTSSFTTASGKLSKDGATSAADTTVKQSWINAGGDLGDGLIQGINSKMQAVKDAGFNLGKEAVKGEKEGQESNSPSKATIRAGKWMGEGLVIGMNRMGKAVYNAGYDMGETATNSIGKTISNIASVIDSDMDVQPTIRPVLDLSDVSNGVGAIDNMLSKRPSVELLSNVGAINTSMNRRRQNGANDEVVSAIDKLRGDIGNINNTSYNINGVTYNQGDDVAQAIETLVRATVINNRR